MVWICLIFKDGTKQLVHSSLDKTELDRGGIEYRPGFIWDFDKQRYIELVDEISSVDVTDDKPELNLVDTVLQKYL